MIKEVKIKSNVQGLELYSDEYPFRLALRTQRFENEASYNQFIKNCERILRLSLEYKLWKDYILDVLQINSCMITNEKMDEIGIEVHHHIPSLYTLVKTLINKKIENSEEFATFDIALEGIELHFANKIGYAVLISDMHKKFHNGFLNIPIEFIKGNYQAFISEHSRYIDGDDLDLINRRIATKLENCPEFDWGRNNYPIESVG